MWKTSLDGRRLRFRLAGINNQNFLARDEETGSWWQQATGEAILGPLAGRRLEPIAWDEVTFAVWKAEHPSGRVLLPDPEAAQHYASADWEDEIARLPVPSTADSSGAVKPRDLVVGVASGDASVAYPWTALAPENPIVDVVGGTPILLVLHPDGKSLRCFDRRVDGSALELFLELGTNPPFFVDRQTGSRWDFGGLAVQGALAGRRLSRVTFLKDYWFDWKAYHPATSIASNHVRIEPGG